MSEDGRRRSLRALWRDDRYNLIRKYHAEPASHVQGVLIALLAVLLIVVGAYPLGVEPDEAPYDGWHRAFLWTAVAIGSIILLMMLISLTIRVFSHDE